MSREKLEEETERHYWATRKLMEMSRNAIDEAVSDVVGNGVEGMWLERTRKARFAALSRRLSGTVRASLINARNEGLRHAKEARKAWRED